MTVEDISKQHNGLFHVPAVFAADMMPILRDPMLEFLEYCGNLRDYTCDVKVHMLMPNQYPCIPNWHYDMVPRGDDGKQDFSRIDPKASLWLWLSGPPLTTFEDRIVSPRTWTKFTQRDLHRGQVSTEHTWRLFIRLCPSSILAPEQDRSKWVRRHSQVYLDANNFTW